MKVKQFLVNIKLPTRYGSNHDSSLSTIPSHSRTMETIEKNLYMVKFGRKSLPISRGKWHEKNIRKHTVFCKEEIEWLTWECKEHREMGKDFTSEMETH
jgi:hypothetical protein